MITKQILILTIGIISAQGLSLPILDTTDSKTSGHFSDVVSTDKPLLWLNHNTESKMFANNSPAEADKSWTKPHSTPAKDAVTMTTIPLQYVSQDSSTSSLFASARPTLVAATSTTGLPTTTMKAVHKRELAQPEANHSLGQPCGDDQSDQQANANPEGKSNDCNDADNEDMEANKPTEHNNS